MKNKNNILRILGMVALLIIMLPSLASSDGWPAAWFEWTRNPDPPVAGQPITMNLSIIPTERAPTNWVGHITFRVYDPANNLIYTSGSSISAENNFASASFTPPTAGMYPLEIYYDSPYDNEGFGYGCELPVSEGTSVPEAHAGESYQTNEGSPITFDASQSNDPDGDPLQYRWDFESDGTWDTQWSNEPLATHTWNDDWSGNAKLEVSDGKLTASDTATVTVNNVNPILDKIASPVAPVLVNTPVKTSCTFTDAGTKDTHTDTWDWIESASSSGSVTESNGAGTVTGEHTYADAGIYRVNLAVTDNNGGTASATAENYVVVYDPQGGFVTGGGWINSPAEAYMSDKTLAGKATFGFVSKYQKGATVPTGNTEFQFKVANLNFHSESYDWLVVAGSQAKFKGTGTINGQGNYGFMLSAFDGAPDKFRIKIWEKESGNTIYDNEIGKAEDSEPTTSIDGGSIIIHTGK